MPAASPRTAVGQVHFWKLAQQTLESDVRAHLKIYIRHRIIVFIRKGNIVSTPWYTMFFYIDLNHYQWSFYLSKQAYGGVTPFKR